MAAPETARSASSSSSVSVSVTIEGKDLSLSDMKDLGKASSNLKFIHQGVTNLDKPIGLMPEGSLGTLTLDAGNPCWKLGGSPAKFSLKAKATGSITLQSKGALFTYCTDFAGADQVNVPCAAGKVYLVTDFQFNISGDLSANVPLGATGVTVSTDDSASLTYAVKNYIAVDPSMTCSAAIQTALQRFVLPLHEGTINNLADGDAIYYEFDGALNVGFGASYGIKYSVGGYSLSELGGVFKQVNGVAAICAKKSTVGASAGLSAKFSWSRSFKALLQRTGNKSARLHIDAGKDSQRSVTLSANAGITELAPPQLSIDAATLTKQIQHEAMGNATPPANSMFASGANQAESALQGEVKKYVDDGNKWVQGLFQKVQKDTAISISLLIQDTQHFVSAFTWDFDLSNANYAKAWQDAIDGDFVKAMATTAATLVPDSGFEQLHYKNTKLSFALFGISGSSISTYFTQSDVHYKGNGIFYLEFKTGDLQASQSKKASSSTELYLDATATGAPNADGSFDASNLEIRFHGILSSHNNAGQASRMRALLISLLDAPHTNPAGDATLKSYIEQWSGAGTQIGTASSSVHLVYTFPVLKTLLSDVYTKGNQPPPPHLLDKKNWQAYVLASENVASEPRAYLASDMQSTFYESYDAWANFNQLNLNPSGTPAPGGKTDRHFFSAGALDNQEGFVQQLVGGTVSDTTADQVIFHFAAGQQYMNFCDDLHSTIAAIDQSASIDWERITNRLERIAGDDIDAWFGPTVMLALAYSSKLSALNVEKQSLRTDAAGITVNIS